MRAALFLAAALVVANARSKWRADRAMLPAPATLPGYPANHTQKHNPEQCSHTLAAQMTFEKKMRIEAADNTLITLISECVF